MTRRFTFGVSVALAAATLMGGASERVSGDPPSPGSRWTRQGVLVASSGDLAAGLSALRLEVQDVIGALVERVASDGTGPPVLAHAFRTFAAFPTSEGVRACLRKLDVTAPVPGILSRDDAEWKWPARKALTEMGWAAVPDILAWLELSDRSEADLKTVSGILRDILGPEVGLAVLQGELSKLESDRERREAAERLRRVLPTVEQILKTPVRR